MYTAYQVNERAIGEIRWTDDNGKAHHAWFAKSDDAWAKQNDMQHEIYFSGADVVRFANVKKTCVYVAIDEDSEGKPVYQRWDCKAKFYQM